MEPLVIVLLIAVGIGAGFVQRVSGFGLCIFSMLFLPLFLPSHTTAVAISGLFSCSISAYNAIRYRKHIPFKTVAPQIISSLMVIPFAVYFSVWVPQTVFKILLGIVLIILSIYFLFFNGKQQIKATVRNGIFSGALGGALGGLFSTGGPPVVLYITHAVKDNIAYFAALQFYFAVTDIYATAMRAFNGVITKNILFYAAIGFGGCLIGDFIGKFVFDKLNAKTLKYVIYIGMIISGIIMII
ncbi:MAG: sulfite exporter TauE/SafE family protein [Ruminococcaceae bacterium]|nr:sulfite exporter TauE/SafE family protein [Oscillospiraceae bacterium]